jgi:hypothetical protein
MRLSDNKYGDIYTRDVKNVKEKVSNHMRTDETAIDNLKKDMVKFDDYVNFDFGSIHTEHIKNQVERYVGREFEKSVSVEDNELMRYPTYPSFSELSQGLN